MQIVWFRRDLRLTDNEIISVAAQNQQAVLPCFVVDPWFYRQPEIAAPRVKFLFESLENLDTNLRKCGSRLYLFVGESVATILSLTRSLLELEDRPKLFFNRDIQVKYGMRRDRTILDFYQQHQLDVHVGRNHFLQDKEDYATLWQDYHCYQKQAAYPTPQQINTPQLNFDLPRLEIAELKEKYRQFLNAESYIFMGGEDNAQNTLKTFVSHRYRGYHWKMSRPWMAQQGATSHLSAHLDFGTISSRTVYQKVIKAEKNLPQSKDRFSLKSFCDRLRWHDKFSQRHYFHPELAWKNRYPEFDAWYSAQKLTGEKQELFQSWCGGKTGFPLVDASMRQLNTIGWMNFRMRAMCVTFLCINCGVSWHHGAQYFMSKLVDGNIAINHWQWQAQAGVTNPMSATFRIYNPTKNLEEKDPHLQFVRYWIPELRRYNMAELRSRKYSTNSSYPQPILDFKQTRKTNGKIVADLRKKVRARLEAEGGEEYQQALGAAETIEKYLTVEDKQYRAMKSL
ncbi:MAG: FAD-binding domain-containing protein [Cyanobacteria bacterium P01_G01_bin.19]